MGVAWLEDFRASLTRILNLKGEGPPQYIPVSDQLNLVYDVTDLVSIDNESGSNISLRRLLGNNLDLLQNPLPGYGTITVSPDSIPGNFPYKFSTTDYSWNLLHSSIPSVNVFNGFGSHYLLEVGTYKFDIVAGIKSTALKEAKDLLPCVAKVVLDSAVTAHCVDWDDLYAIGPNKLASTINTEDLLVSVSFIMPIKELNHYVVGIIGNTTFNPDEQNYLYASATMLSEKTITYPLIGAI